MNCDKPTTYITGSMWQNAKFLDVKSSDKYNHNWTLDGKGRPYHA